MMHAFQTQKTTKRCRLDVSRFYIPHIEWNHYHLSLTGESIRFFCFASLIMWVSSPLHDSIAWAQGGVVGRAGQFRSWCSRILLERSKLHVKAMLAAIPGAVASSQVLVPKQKSYSVGANIPGAAESAISALWHWDFATSGRPHTIIRPSSNSPASSGMN